MNPVRHQYIATPRYMCASLMCFERELAFYLCCLDSQLTIDWYIFLFAAVLTVGDTSSN
jgi:hypothetical protein